MHQNLEELFELFFFNYERVFFVLLLMINMYMKNNYNKNDNYL